MSVTIGTKTLNWACGLFATLLGIAVLPLAVFSAYWAWLAWALRDWLFFAYYAVVALLWVGVPLVFLCEYDRWQKKRGLQ